MLDLAQELQLSRIRNTQTQVASQTTTTYDQKTQSNQDEMRTMSDESRITASIHTLFFTYNYLH